MDENHQDATGSKLIATNNKLWTPSLSTKDQKKLDRFRKKPLAQRMGLKGKTLWDWLQLLIIPLVLAEGGYLYGTWQHNTDQKRALDQQQATVLQTYMDNIQDLLLNHNLLKSKLSDDVAVLARARTLTALQGLDSQRKGALLQFLYEAQLIGTVDPKTGKDVAMIISLDSAHLDSADLNDADLDGADLSGASVTQEQLAKAYSLKGAIMPNGSTHP